MYLTHHYCCPPVTAASAAAHQSLLLLRSCASAAVPQRPLLLQAIVMVVDSSEPQRMHTTREELFQLLGREDLVGAHILVFANKQDIEGSLSAAEVSDKLELHTIGSHEWHIQGCCALTGEGLLEGLEWVVSKLQ